MASLQIDWQTFLLPFLAGFLVLLTHIPLGKRVIQRQVVFIDLAIAQFAAFGVVLAQIFDLDSKMMAQFFAFGFALIGAFFCFWLEHFFKHKQEALMGCSFVVIACAGLLLASHGGHGAEQVETMLAGQLLWVNFSDLIVLAVMALLLGLISMVWSRALQHSLIFYILLSACVTASVQMIGVYLVFASLMMPALIQTKGNIYHRSFPITAGVLGYGLGIVLSIWFDLPTGAVVVCSLAFCCIVLGCLGVAMPLLVKGNQNNRQKIDQND